MPLSTSPAPSHLDPEAMNLASIDLSCPFTRSFHKFNELPPEIRIRIWRLAVPRPAVIERAMNYSLMEQTLRRQAPIPGVLQVCRESRAELLYEREHRRGGTQEQFELVHSSGASGRGAYVNCEKDTLYIYRAPPRATMPDAANFANIQHLAMDWGLRPCWVQGQCLVGIHFIRQFPSLKTLTLLVTFHVHAFGSSEDGEFASKVKQQERIQRRRALCEIKSWVMDAIRETKESLPDWKAPEVRAVRKTDYWTGGKTSTPRPIV
ncbi:hypothetical protein CGCSCA4_v006695 [Colletotrichum siamense]|uniref:2EXR domain-containing protein n=1 Tax=Colletotrichum siamense TaxID=690259 RepID=A0A9P5EWA5_COLSI|nr:uncharacterized protein CGCS363_v014098 [Colletotrichum siamense]KAF4845364.1 hypothetical protein CGCSCA4_v006695 [Colletotrichum siamense]KAF4860791.1 hypothetical protein CGCSCA2_v004983 [Colletotrichum siamense]KAF5484811.1 hypothetical protein CGCS363_v014098 [Colletotrichum siamense]